MNEVIMADVRRAQAALVDAELAEHPAERFLAAHGAALRVAAIILSVRAHGARNRLGNVWQLLARNAPEFAEWASFFSATQLKCQAVAAGAVALVTAREADDLLRDAQAFYAAVVRRLSGQWQPYVALA